MTTNEQQEGLAVASIARDDPSPLPPEIPDFPSDNPGEAFSVSSEDIHLSKHAKVSLAPCDHNAQMSQTAGH